MTFFKIITIWFIFQMIVIGIVQVNVDRQVEEETYQCSKYHGSNFNYYKTIIVFPILTFYKEPITWANYCNNHK